MLKKGEELKRIASSVIVVSLFLSLLAFALIQPAKATGTIIVPDDYPTIQEAINAANAGDTIFVRNGTYRENVVVNKTVSLIGENKNTTIIDGNKTGSVVKIAANNTIVSWLTIQNSGTSFADSGIWLYHVNGSTISNNIIRNNGYYGINAEFSVCNVTGNHVGRNKDTGIWLFRGPVKDISYVCNNTVENNGYEGIALSYTKGVVTGNVVRNNTQYGIILENSFDSSATWNTITDNEWGIHLRDSGFAISNYLIANNVVEDNIGGIDSESSVNATISGNKIIDNKGSYGVVSHAGYASMNNNTISGNSGGAYITGADGSTLKKNLIMNNENYGILLHSDSCTIQDNQVLNSDIGISIEGSANSIYHNSFSNNTKQVQSYNLTNTLDNCYPSGGNYWSDYAEEDMFSGLYQNETGSDGIGDEPYIIDSDNRDNYPLMKPYPWGTHDIGITSFTTPKTIIAKGTTLIITVIVFNYGTFPENFNIMLYANTTILFGVPIAIASRNSIIANFHWDTTSYAYGNYTITATITTVLGETDITDNACILGTVTVTILGDYNGDYTVNNDDVDLVRQAWQSRQGQANYNPNADFNMNGIINIADAAMIGVNWQKHA
jgi:parallel beta-helix repeat protein